MAAVEVFMDTAGFLALWDAGDGHHAAALWLQQELIRKRRHFLTTEYVVDETITLLLARHSHRAATDFSIRSNAVRHSASNGLIRHVFTPPLTGFANMATNNGPSPIASVSLSCTSSGFAKLLRQIITSGRLALLLSLKPRDNARTAGKIPADSSLGSLAHALESFRVESKSLKV